MKEEEQGDENGLMRTPQACLPTSVSRTTGPSREAENSKSTERKCCIGPAAQAPASAAEKEGESFPGASAPQVALVLLDVGWKGDWAGRKRELKTIPSWSRHL